MSGPIVVIGLCVRHSDYPPTKATQAKLRVMAEAVVELRVPMDCPGCERKVRRALSSVPGVHTVSIERDLQKVIVRGDAMDRLGVLEGVQKVRRNAEFWVEEAAMEEPPPPYDGPSYTNPYHSHYPYSAAACTCTGSSPYYHRSRYAAPAHYTHYYHQYPHYLSHENPNACILM